MSDNLPLDTATHSAQDRRRKRKALLAGGLVLGIGAVATLAAFSDDIHANGKFNTGSFNVEGSTSSSSAGYEEYNSAPGGNLSFQLNALQMSPGQTVYAPFHIRIDAPSTLNGTSTLNSVQATGALSSLLTYKMASNSTNCSVASPPALYDWAVTNAPAAGPVPASGTTPVNLTANAAGTAGTPIDVCIAVTMSTDQGAVTAADKTNPTTITWGWNAKSVDA